MRIGAGVKIGMLEVGIVGEGYFAPWVRKMALVIVGAGVQEGRCYWRMSWEYCLLKKKKKIVVDLGNSIVKIGGLDVEVDY
jgi:hypothetical protein